MHGQVLLGKVYHCDMIYVSDVILFTAQVFGGATDTLTIQSGPSRDPESATGLGSSHDMAENTDSWAPRSPEDSSTC